MLRTLFSWCVTPIPSRPGPEELREQPAEEPLAGVLPNQASSVFLRLEELQGLLDLPFPDWDEIKKNQPGGMDLADAIA